jgi:hypothetical protein
LTTRISTEESTRGSAVTSIDARFSTVESDVDVAGTGQFFFGAADIGTTTNTRGLAPGYTSGSASTTFLDVDVRQPFTATKIALKARAGGTGAATLTYAVRKNGSATAMTLEVATTAVTGSDTGSVSFAEGDTFGVQVAKSEAISASPTDSFITIGYITP